MDPDILAMIIAASLFVATVCLLLVIRSNTKDKVDRFTDFEPQAAAESLDLANPALSPFIGNPLLHLVPIEVIRIGVRLYNIIEVYKIGTPGHYPSFWYQLANSDREYSWLFVEHSMSGVKVAHYLPCTEPVGNDVLSDSQQESTNGFVSVYSGLDWCDICVAYHRTDYITPKGTIVCLRFGDREPIVMVSTSPLESSDITIL